MRGWTGPSPEHSQPRKSNVPWLHQKELGSKSREEILFLHSVLVNPHLECWFQLWDLQHKDDMDLLERVQGRPKI